MTADAERMMTEILERLRVLAAAITAPGVIEHDAPGAALDELRRVHRYVTHPYERDQEEVAAQHRAMVVQAVALAAASMDDPARADQPPEAIARDVAARVSDVRADLEPLGLRPASDGAIVAALESVGRRRGGRGGRDATKGAAMEALWAELGIPCSYEAHTRAWRRR